MSLRHAKPDKVTKAPVAARRKTSATARDKALVSEVAEIFEAQLKETLAPEVQDEAFKDLWEAVQSHLAQTQEHLTQMQKTFRSLNRKSKARRFVRAPRQDFHDSAKVKEAKHQSHMKF